MNLPHLPKLAQTRAWAGSHKILIGAGAAGVVVVMAIRNRSAAGGDQATADDASALGAGATGGSSTDPQGAAIGGYDSSANDIYNALQPQIEQTQGLIRKLMAKIRTQAKAQRQLERRLKKAQKKAAHDPKVKKPHHHVKSGGGKQQKPTPVKHQTRTLPVRGLAVTGGPQHTKATPAPLAAPRALVTRRATTLEQIGNASGTGLAQMAAANPTVTPGVPVPPQTRVVVPATTRTIALPKTTTAKKNVK